MLKFELAPYNRNVPDEELLNDLRLVACKVGAPSITKEVYTQRGARFGSETIARRFGSWNKALQRAGLSVTQRKDIPNEELYANLESVWRQLGRQPKYDELRSPLSRFSVGPYHNRFGSYRNALLSFVAYINESDPPMAEQETSELKQKELTDPVPRELQSRYIGWRTRFRVMQRDGFRCVKCGRSPATTPGIELHIDHIKAWSKKGPSAMENLETLCSVCNIGKGIIDV